MPEHERNFLRSYPVKDPFIPSLRRTFGQALDNIMTGGCTAINGPALLTVVLNYKPDIIFSELEIDYEAVTDQLNEARVAGTFPYSTESVEHIIRHRQSRLDDQISVTYKSLKLIEDMQRKRQSQELAPEQEENLRNLIAAICLFF